MGVLVTILAGMLLPALFGALEPFAKRSGTKWVLWGAALGPALLIALWVFVVIITTGYRSDAPWIAVVPFALLALAVLIFMTARAIGRPFAQILEERNAEKMKGTFS